METINIVNYSRLFFMVLCLWIIAIVMQKRKKLSCLLSILGIVLLALFITVTWIKMNRPPFKTLGETRLWYALLLPIAALFVNIRYQMNWLTIYANLMSLLFLFINFCKPEAWDKTLAPALQSPWFIPHVVVYMLAYALIAATFLISVKGIKRYYYKGDTEQIIQVADKVLNVGLAFLSMGLIFGALWAKEAWGHYWTWDPKETWALITFFSYLMYVHLRHGSPKNHIIALWFLILNFFILLLCWFGIHYLPSAANSVHTYGQ